MIIKLKPKAKNLLYASFLATGLLGVSNSAHAVCSGCCCCSQCFQAFAYSSATYALVSPSTMTMVSSIVGAPIYNPMSFMLYILRSIGEKGKTVSGSYSKMGEVLSKSVVYRTKVLSEALNKLSNREIKENSLREITKRTHMSKFEQELVKTRSAYPDMKKEYEEAFKTAIQEAMKLPLGEDTEKTSVERPIDILKAEVDELPYCIEPPFDDKQIVDPKYSICSKSEALKKKANFVDIVLSNGGEMNVYAKMNLPDKVPDFYKSQQKLMKMKYDLVKSVTSDVIDRSAFMAFLRKPVFNLGNNPEYMKSMSATGNVNERKQQIILQLSMNNLLLMEKLKSELNLSRLKGAKYADMIRDANERNIKRLKSRVMDEVL